MQVGCDAIRERVLGWVLGHCRGVPVFHRALVDAAWSELEAQRGRQNRADRTLDEEIAELERRTANLAKAVALGGELEALVAQLLEVEGALRSARERRSAALAPPDPSRPSLESRADVERHLAAALAALASGSYEFAKLMRRVLPEFTIVPVQALDTGQVRPRARLVLRLEALLEGHESAEGDGPRPGDIAGNVDLFDPPQHIAAIGACVAARRSDPKLGLETIAARTGYNRMTVKRALAYARRMEAEGLEDPYRELKERPASASRWRHRDAS